MKQMLVLVLAFFVLAAVAVGVSQAELPEHPHALVLGMQFNADGAPIGWRKCIDLAANQALPLNAQHEHMHFGTAGEALFTRAGNGVAPTAPFPGVPWADCDGLADFFGVD